MAINKNATNLKMPSVHELAKLARMAHENDVVAITAGAQALVSCGLNLITGGTGLTGLTLPAPRAGDRCRIVIGSITSGVVVVTTAAGTTLNGTNNTATFDAAADALDLQCLTNGTTWHIVANAGTVALSTV